ncbi:hypothetical protein C5S39_05035, partial [Candidatus Methanophagaceae archaeon]
MTVRKFKGTFIKCMVPKAARTATRIGTMIKTAVIGFRKTKKRTTTMVKTLRIRDAAKPDLT